MVSIRLGKFGGGPKAMKPPVLNEAGSVKPQVGTKSTQGAKAQSEKSADFAGNKASAKNSDGDFTAKKTDANAKTDANSKTNSKTDSDAKDLDGKKDDKKTGGGFGTVATVMVGGVATVGASGLGSTLDDRAKQQDGIQAQAKKNQDDLQAGANSRLSNKSLAQQSPLADPVAKKAEEDKKKSAFGV